MANEIPSFLIMSREALEAALIVAIVIAYLRRVGRQDLSKYAWSGTAGAILSSMALGGAVMAFYGGLGGVAERLFEGLAALTATGVLTYMIFWMARNSRRVKGELEQKVDISITTGQLVGITALAFVAVFREGLETVLFLTALAVQDAAGTSIGVVAGISTVAVLAILLLKGTVRLPIRSFFKYTSVILIIFSAGLFGFGIHELVEVAEDSGASLGWLAQAAFDINPSDGNNLLHEKGILGSILSALIGYDGNPEWLRVLGYLGYWLVIGAYLLRTYSPAPLLNLYGYLVKKAPKD